MIREEREDAIDIIQSILDKYEEDECLVTEITIGDEDIKAFKVAIKALEQESKPMVEIDLYSVIKQKYVEREVLDKIRAEILRISSYGGYELGGYKDGYINAMANVISIIDKYKAESEE